MRKAWQFTTKVSINKLNTREAVRRWAGGWWLPFLEKPNTEFAGCSSIQISEDSPKID